MSGHLFIVRGDLLHLACDAILVPSGLGGDRPGFVSRDVWRTVLDGHLDSEGFLREPPDEEVRVRRLTPGRPRQPAVWAGHTGKAEAEPSWYADAVRRFIAEAARDGATLEFRPLGDARPLLALPLVGTGDGGAALHRGEVLKEVMSTIRDALAAEEADAVLVLNHDEGFSAAQRARERCWGDAAWEDLTDGHRDVARRLADRARRNDLVAFVGAGAGIGAGLPSWRTLLERLATEYAGLDCSDIQELWKMDARDAGAVLEKILGGKDALGAAVAAVVQSDHVSLVHQLLASLPIREGVTTNYDLCLETSFDDADRPLRVLPRQGAGGAERWLVKLHGSIDDRDRIVLSRDDYLRFEGQSAALAGIVQALLLTRHMMFVGYSMSDDNFHRIVHQVRAVIGAREERPEQAAFATALSPDSPGLSNRLWDGDVDFVSTARDDQRDPRRLAILLDLIVAEAAPPAAALLDDTYRALFTADEWKLRKELIEVLDQVNDPEKAIPPSVRSVVRSSLAGIGRVGRPHGPRLFPPS